MAAMMKSGGLPVAADPHNPGAAEKKAVQEKIRQHREVYIARWVGVTRAADLI